MALLTVALLARLSLVLPASYPVSVPILSGPVKCDPAPGRRLTISGHVALVGPPLGDHDSVTVWSMRAGAAPTGELVTSDLITGHRVGKDGKYGPIEGTGGVLLRASAPGYGEASVLVQCSSTVDFILVPSAAGR
jgi:hypothetical protein